MFLSTAPFRTGLGLFDLSRSFMSNFELKFVIECLVELLSSSEQS